MLLYGMNVQAYPLTMKRNKQLKIFGNYLPAFSLLALLAGSPCFGLKPPVFDGPSDYALFQKVLAPDPERPFQVKLKANPTTWDNIYIRLTTIDHQNKVTIRLTGPGSKVFFDESVEARVFNGEYRIAPETKISKGIYILEVMQNGVVSKHKIIVLPPKP